MPCARRQAYRRKSDDGSSHAAMAMGCGKVWRKSSDTPTPSAGRARQARGGLRQAEPPKSKKGTTYAPICLHLPAPLVQPRVERLGQVRPVHGTGIESALSAVARIKKEQKHTDLLLPRAMTAPHDVTVSQSPYGATSHRGRVRDSSLRCPLVVWCMARVLRSTNDPKPIDR